MKRRTANVNLFALSLTAALLAYVSFLQMSAADDPALPSSITDFGETRIAQAPGTFDVHEWGLIRFGATTEIATSGFGLVVPGEVSPSPDPTFDEDRPATRKPVIYIHPGPDFDPSTEISVSITLTEGSLREIWPTPAAGGQPSLGSSHTWSPITVTPGISCGSELAPSLDDEACQTLTDGGVCEAAEMALYLGMVPHCLSVGSPAIQSPVLLYNGYVTLESPVALSVGTTGHTVSNLSEGPVGPLWVVADEKVFVVEVLGVGESLLLEAPIPHFSIDSLTDLLSQVNSALVERGLTSVEAEHFVTAWRPDVLAQPLPWQTFGFYGDEAIDAAFPLTIDPTPAETRRVLAFTVE